MEPDYNTPRALVFSIMLKRPSKHDTEEDLLRMQEEFLQQQPSPSVKLVKKPDKRRSDPEEFSQSKGR